MPAHTTVRHIGSPSLTACKHCGEMIQTYRACPACGYYKGRQVVKIAEEKTTD